MTEFVIVYAFTVDENQRRIPMVLKDKPNYLRGLLNLPGGKLEKGETPIDAAIRELKEETGLEDLGVTDGMCPIESEVMGVIKAPGDGYLIHCVKVPITYRQELKPQEGETEPVDWYDADTVLGNPKLMPNLRLIIPFMDAGFKGWQILCHDWHEYEHLITLNCNGTDNWNSALRVTVPGLTFYRG